MVVDVSARVVELIRVGVVDDHAVVRDGTAALLDREPDIEVVGVAATLQSAAALLELRPDVLVVDIRIGEENGLELVRNVAASGGPAIVILPRSTTRSSSTRRFGRAPRVTSSRRIPSRMSSARSGRSPPAVWRTRSDRHRPAIGPSASARSESCRWSSKDGRTMRSLLGLASA